MKIGSKLKLAALVPVLIALVIGIALLFSFKTMDEAQEKAKTAHRIIQGIFYLNSMSRSYMLYHEDRPKAQFMSEHDSISGLIRSIRFTNGEERRILDRIGRGSESIWETFIKLIANNEHPEAALDSPLHKEVDERLSGRLLIQTSDALSDALLLEHRIDEGLTATHKRISTLIFLLILATTLPLTYILIRMMRRIGASLAELRRGIGVVASGNLDHRIGMTATDEIGELARSFDFMTEKLRETTVSRDALSKEVMERKRAEEAVRDQREWLRVTLSSIGDAVIASDTGGRITFINPVAAALTGWTIEEAMGCSIQSIFRIVDEKTRKPAEEIVGRVLAEGNVVNLANHTALLTRGRQEIPIEDSAAPIKDGAGNLIGVVLVFHDVTGKRRAQAALSESAEKLRIVSDFTYDWEYWRTPDDRFLYVSPSCERITGYTREEFIEDPDLNCRIIHPEDRGRVLAHLREAQLHSELCELEFRIIHRNGDTRWIGHACRPVLDPRGKPIGRRASNRDITGAKKAEEELEKSREDLEVRVQERTAELRGRAEQLSLLASELTLAEERERRRLAEILHDHLQQLLVGAKLSVESLSPSISEDQQYIFRHACNMLMESIKVSRSLTAELSPAVLYQRGLSAGLEWLANWMEEKYELAVQLEIDPEIEVDREDMTVLLFRSIRELLFNVVKHARINSAEVRVSREGPDHLRIVVSDRGAGFDPIRIWENGGQASGFGMFTIRERLELLGGRLEIESSPGNGSIFTLIAPFQKTEPSEAKPEPRQGGVGPAPPMDTEKRIRLMVVDDHIVMRQGLSTMLNSQPDIEIVAEAGDGEAAVQLARKHKPDAILMDIGMPKLNGIEATRIIHSELPEIRVVALSMFEDPEIAASVFEAGAVAYLTKTGNTDALLAEIRRIRVQPVTRNSDSGGTTRNAY